MFKKTLQSQNSKFFFSHTNDCWKNNAFDYPVLARVTKPAPHFEGMSYYINNFKKISLSDYKGKYVVLFFYPLDFTFVCPTEIKAFNDKADEFKKIGKDLNNCNLVI